MIYNFDIYDTDYNKVYEMGYSGTSYEVALEIPSGRGDYSGIILG